jgi:hypothetical protein
MPEWFALLIYIRIHSKAVRELHSKAGMVDRFVFVGLELASTCTWNSANRACMTSQRVASASVEERARDTPVFTGDLKWPNSTRELPAAIRGQEAGGEARERHARWNRGRVRPRLQDGESTQPLSERWHTTDDYAFSHHIVDSARQRIPRTLLSGAARQSDAFPIRCIGR